LAGGKLPLSVSNFAVDLPKDFRERIFPRTFGLVEPLAAIFACEPNAIWKAVLGVNQLRIAARTKAPKILWSAMGSVAPAPNDAEEPIRVVVYDACFCGRAPKQRAKHLVNSHERQKAQKEKDPPWSADKNREEPPNVSGDINYGSNNARNERGAIENRCADHRDDDSIANRMLFIGCHAANLYASRRFARVYI